MHPNWFMMTTIMPLCFTTCIFLTFIQYRCFKWYSNVVESDIYKKKKELFCLYGVYLMGATCAIQCFMCHVSNFFPEWYCLYGMPICVIFYAATKTFLYGFFLERAKCAQSTDFLLPKVVKKYVLPGYILSYFIIYVILCPLSFRGEVIDPSETDSIPTACIFGKFTSWVFDLSAVVDIFNSIFFLFLFAYPLYCAIKQKEHFTDSTAHQNLRNELLKTIKYNIVCSSICSISSVSFLFIMSFAKNNDIGYYLWFGGNIDIMINSICMFLMVGANRKYVFYLWNKAHKTVTKEDDDDDEINGELPKFHDNNSMKLPNKPNMSELTTNSVVSIDTTNIDTNIQCDFANVTTPVHHNNSNSSGEIVFEIQTCNSEKVNQNDAKTIVVLAND
eukprot:462706_1